jgi:exopolysaccharide biosynthesis protein
LIRSKLICVVQLLTGLSFATSAEAIQTVTEPFLGVKLYHRTETSPRPLNISVFEIDLAAPGLSFLVTPRGPSPQPVFNGVPDETVIQMPRQFANSVGAQIAINTTFYAISAIHNVDGKNWTNNLGLVASRGDAYSKWEPPPRTDNNFDDALNISATNQASFVKMPANVVTGYETSPSVTLYNTVTGKNRLLQSGATVAPTSCGSFCDLNPRSAAGLTSNNAKLLLMTVDGRQAGFSEGVTLVELAGYMASYGATNAINLDGGGSTQMVANYFGDTTSAKLVNSPSESERSVGASLAVYALPNGDFNQNGMVDTADYVTWRNSIGGQLGYNTWRSKFGTRSAAAGETVPEPTPAVLLFACCALLLLSGNCRDCAL